MKLTARKDITLDNDYVDIRYRELTPKLHQIFQICENTGSVLLCEKDGATHKVDINDVLYIEFVDRKSYVCTKYDVFVISTALSKLEEMLNSEHFIKVSRMALVNLFKIKSVSSGLNLRRTVEMVNGEKIVITRHYRNVLAEAIQKLAGEVT